MKKILLLNNSKHFVSFDVIYSLSTSNQSKEISTSPFPKSVFRIIEIPDNSKNISITINTVDSKGKKQIIRHEKQEKALNICYDASDGLTKTEVKTTACQNFNGSYSIYGINKTSSIIRVKFTYKIDGQVKSLVSDPVKKNNAFSFLTPANSKQLQIKIEKAVNISKDRWSQFYTESFSNQTTPVQKCYSITKPVLRDIKCTLIDCLKFM